MNKNNKEIAYDLAYELTNKIHLFTHAGTLSALTPLFEELVRLRKRNNVLQHLEENGVDNWENYSLPEEI